jgi:hypothetical protein
VGLNAITREAWNTAQSTEDRIEKIQALSLAKECYSMKLDLLTNATVVDDAIRFVSSNKSEERQKLSENSNEDDKESREPDYNGSKWKRRRNNRHYYNNKLSILSNLNYLFSEYSFANKRLLMSLSIQIGQNGRNLNK